MEYPGHFRVTESMCIGLGQVIDVYPGEVLLAVTHRPPQAKAKGYSSCFNNPPSVPRTRANRKIRVRIPMDSACNAAASQSLESSPRKSIAFGASDSVYLPRVSKAPIADVEMKVAGG